ncbi:hypothetical protein CH281_23425 [Rhodococcus sp. 06-221-2]|uniref:glycosyltransferase family 4 protein n=1 Tax=Rhodococcus sp. 06-221-2 TaxID=2022514 RepID=UPI000B9A3214|nr:glycosyltransferase family 4 protein [Rhodococcus sp. 06-221-2]OZC96811.1 hypothetical protein CH281_23425 [Rhodococcus sp. 06-221-2]
MNEYKLRIRLVSLNYTPEQTGIGPYVADLASGLVDRGHCVEVVTGYPHYPSWTVDPKFTGFRSSSTLHGVKIRRVRQYTPKSPSYIRRVVMETSFGIQAVFRSSDRCDVILCTSPALFATAVVILTAKLSKNRPRLGVWVQDIYSSGLAETSQTSKRLSSLVEKLEGLTFRSADGVVVIHERFREILNKRLNIPNQNITTIRNWTHIKPQKTKSREDTRMSLGWGLNEHVVLHAGNMGVKQGLENVVEAARMAEDQALNIRFVLLGDGNQREKLENIGRHIKKLQFIRPLDDVQFQSALNAADILLVNESIGVVEMAVPSKLTTYFSIAKPILAATDQRSATASEISQSGAGLRVDPGNPADLISGVTQIMNENDTVKSYGKNGMKYLHSKLDRSHAIDQFESWALNIGKQNKTKKGNR